MAKRRKPLAVNEPLRHADHRRPRTRREFISQGFMAGAGTVMGSSIFSLFANPRAAYALSPDLTTAVANCGIATQGAGKIPFICFDLAGGVNISGSNVLVGGQGGQMDFLSTAGYSKLGLPGDMVPGLTEATPTTTSNGDHTDTSLGLAFHSDSSFLRGILEKAPTAVGSGNINGAVIPARSDNDTGNNPHNPMYGIAKAGLAGAGADGSLVTLVGSRNSDSGGNSMAPAMMIDPSIRPTKIDRPSDVTGLVDVGDFGALSQAEAVAVMESVYRISDDKLGNVDTKMTNNLALLDQVRCGYVKSADLAERFGDPSQINPDDRLGANPVIVSDAGGIFSTTEFDGDSEFRKSASVMKMVVDGFAGAGTITMGGYDYHTGDRASGEVRDLRAGRCMGACLEYAARVGVPLMLYVCSDGSVASNGREDNSVDGRGKGEWTGDNSSTAASFFLVYNPGSRPVLIGATPEEQAVHQQIGYMRADASVETAATPAANNVNLLVETVILNYMALHGEQNEFANIFPTALGGLVDSLTAFEPIVNGTIT
ncbi:MAG: hypothetical protein ACR2P1_24145 [Pseudomonadales bacterium]